MLTLAALACAAFALTFAFTPVCRGICLRLRLVDHPDHRKLHGAPVPRTGGIAIFAGYAFAMGLMALPVAGGLTGGLTPAREATALLPAVWIVFVTGLLDDIIGLKPWVKLGGQTLAAAAACAGGVEIQSLAGIPAGNAWWHVPLTIVWLVGCSNAFNLIDGLDGLAAGIGLFAAVTAFLSAILHGNLPLALVTAPLIGALLGFLPYNFNPASIFMGDCGSLTVGFLLGCFGITWSQKSATVFGLTAPMVALAVPLLDTSLAIARRFLRGEPLFGADRGHIHHRLLARGLTARHAAYILYAFAGIGAGLSLLLGFTPAHFGGLALVAFCVIALAGVHYLRYEEFAAARRVLFGGLFHRAMRTSLSIRELERGLRDARSVEQCWAAILEASRGFGFSYARLDWRDWHLAASLLDNSGEYWSARIPLNGSGSLDLSVPFRSTQPLTIHALARSLRTVLPSKLEEFTPADAGRETGIARQRLGDALRAASEHGPSGPRAALGFPLL